MIVNVNVDVDVNVDERCRSCGATKLPPAATSLELPLSSIHPGKKACFPKPPQPSPDGTNLPEGTSQEVAGLLLLLGRGNVLDAWCAAADFGPADTAVDNAKVKHMVQKFPYPIF